MIIRNPQNGAPVRKDVAGKIYRLPVNSGPLRVEDKIGEELIATYPFLEKVEAVDLPPKEVDGQYVCPLCDFGNSVKAVTASHFRTHNQEDILAAVPAIEVVGEVSRRPTIFEARSAANRIPAHDLPNGKDTDGVEWTGEGYIEERPASRNVGGIPGHFATAD